MNISIEIEVTGRKATCDFCGQRSIWCYSTKNAENMDVCRSCIHSISDQLKKESENNLTVN